MELLDHHSSGKSYTRDLICPVAEYQQDTSCEKMLTLLHIDTDPLRVSVVFFILNVSEY